MSDALVAALTAQHAVHAGLRLRHGDEWDPDGCILGTGRGTPLKPSNVSSAPADSRRRKALGPADPASHRRLYPP